jgi:hypothetical protein
VPLLLGLAVVLSLRTKRPLVRTVLMNDQIIDVARVDEALKQRGTQATFEALLRRASYGLAGCMALVAVLHFFLIRYILTSPPGTEAFNNELGRVHMLNIPIVMIPSMIVLLIILWRTVQGIENLTGLTTDEIFHADKK